MRVSGYGDNDWRHAGILRAYIAIYCISNCYNINNVQKFPSNIYWESWCTFGDIDVNWYRFLDMRWYLAPNYENLVSQFLNILIKIFGNYQMDL